MDTADRTIANVAIHLDLQALRSSCTHADSVAPMEACGLFAGPAACPDHIDRFVPMKNHASDQGRFQVDPLEFSRVDHRLTRAGRQVRGFVHSHPAGAALLSQADLHHAWPGYLQFLLTRSTDFFDRITIFDSTGKALQSIHLPPPLTGTKES